LSGRLLSSSSRRVGWLLVSALGIATAIACGADDPTASPPSSVDGGDGTDGSPSDDDGGTSRDGDDEDSGRADSGNRNDAGFAPPVACGAVLPGEPMRPGLVEGQPGYADELAATDTSAVADPFDYSAESTLIRGVINFMLLRGGAGTSITRADALASGPMGKAVLAAAAKGTGGRVNIQFLRRGLHYHYPCARPVPKDLATLKARYGDFKTWPTRTIGCSRPKNVPRRIHENQQLGIYIAETLITDPDAGADADAGAVPPPLDAGVRETEILFTKLRTDDQIDFAVYTQAGDLSDRSTFATGGGGAITSSSPYTCMSCHLDSASGKFSDLNPTGTGAGCQ